MELKFRILGLGFGGLSVTVQFKFSDLGGLAFRVLTGYIIGSDRVWGLGGPANGFPFKRFLCN